MKKLINIALTLCAAVVMGTSCGINEEGTVVYKGFASLVENIAGASTPYYAILDDGKTAFVTNTKNWGPTFKPNTPEVRYWLNYEIVNDKAVGYDYEIRLLSTKECMPTQYYLPSFADSNIDAEKYNGAAQVVSCYLSPATNWLTLTVGYNTSNDKMNTPPKMALVQNTPENSPYKDLYADDNYFYVELYHDDSEYKGTQPYYTDLGCKLLMPNVTQMMDSYSGIKIIGVDPTSYRPQVYTFNFTTEDQK